MFDPPLSGMGGSGLRRGGGEVLNLPCPLPSRGRGEWSQGVLGVEFGGSEGSVQLGGAHTPQLWGGLIVLSSDRGWMPVPPNSAIHPHPHPLALILTLTPPTRGGLVPYCAPPAPSSTRWSGGGPSPPAPRPEAHLPGSPHGPTPTAPLAPPSLGPLAAAFGSLSGDWAGGCDWPRMSHGESNFTGSPASRRALWSRKTTKREKLFSTPEINDHELLFDGL